MDDRSILGGCQPIARFALHRFEGSTSRSAVESTTQSSLSESAQLSNQSFSYVLSIWPDTSQCCRCKAALLGQPYEVQARHRSRDTAFMSYPILLIEHWQLTERSQVRAKSLR